MEAACPAQGFRRTALASIPIHGAAAGRMTVAMATGTMATVVPGGSTRDGPTATERAIDAVVATSTTVRSGSTTATEDIGEVSGRAGTDHESGVVHARCLLDA